MLPLIASPDCASRSTAKTGCDILLKSEVLMLKRASATTQAPARRPSEWPHPPPVTEFVMTQPFLPQRSSMAVFSLRQFAVLKNCWQHLKRCRLLEKVATRWPRDGSSKYMTLPSDSMSCPFFLLCHTPFAMTSCTFCYIWAQKQIG